MTELKTLKDLFVCGLNCKYNHFVDTHELKQEAIKWVKVYLGFDKIRYWDSLTPFISFFNLTEEDLK